MSMEFPTVSLVDVASYLPENRVPTEYFTQFSRSERMAKNVMFRSPTYRHHVAPDETAVDMVERAAAPLIERHGRDTIDNVDVLLTHVQLPDNPVLGSGPEVARRLGLRPDWVIDVHNGGCASFPHMMALAQKILQTTDAKTAMIAAVQNAAGPSMTQSEIRKLAFAPVPGDGCGVGLLVKNEDAPILGVVGRTYPEFAGDMTFEGVGLPKDAVPRKYWEPGIGQPTIGFTESKIAKVFTRGNRLVPEVGYAVLEEIDAKSGRCRHFRQQPAQPSVPAKLARRVGDSRREATRTPSTSAATCSARAFPSRWTPRTVRGGSRTGRWC